MAQLGLSKISNAVTNEILGEIDKSMKIASTASWDTAAAAPSNVGTVHAYQMK